MVNYEKAEDGEPETSQSSLLDDAGNLAIMR
jgi:hypothetical protein